MAGRVAGKVAFITGAGARPGPQPRDPAGRGGRRHHRGRHLPRLRHGGLPDGDRGRPGRDGQGGRGAGPPDRRDPGRRARRRRAEGGGRRRRGPARPARHRLRQRGHLHRAGLGRGDPGGLAGHPGHQPDRGLEHHGGQRAAPDRGGGGSIICTSSTAGIKGLPYLAPYIAAKHGVVGIARTMANELARHRIRVNTVHPTGVNTPMGNDLGGLEPLINQTPTSARST